MRPLNNALMSDPAIQADNVSSGVNIKFSDNNVNYYLMN